MYYLKDICYLCLKQDENTTSVINIGCNIQEMLQYIVPEFSLKGSEILRKICNNCVSTLNTILNFRQKCQDSIKTYNEYVQKLSQGNGTLKYLAVQLTDIILQNVKSEPFDDFQQNSEQIEEELNSSDGWEIEMLDTGYDSSVTENQSENYDMIHEDHSYCINLHKDRDKDMLLVEDVEDKLDEDVPSDDDSSNAANKFDKTMLLQNLQDWNLIPRALQCKKCGANLALRVDNSCIDRWTWRCRRKIAIHKKKAKVCEFSQSFRSGTFFARSKCPIPKILAFVDMWVGNVTLQQITDELRLSNGTCVDWASLCREVLLTYFIDNPTKLGGPDEIVEIDESVFRKRDFHRGRLVAGERVFGAYERSSGRICFTSTIDRGADALIPVIKEWIEPGTTIASNFWKTSKCLARSSYIQLKNDHVVNFIDSDNANDNNGAINPTTPPVPGNLARTIFNKKCLALELNRTVEFYRLIGEVYNGSRQQLVEWI